jgi:hypothetical protein
MRDKSVEQLRYELRGCEIRLEAVIAERMKLEYRIATLSAEIRDLEAPPVYTPRPLRATERIPTRRAPQVRSAQIEYATPALESLL